MKRPTRIMVFGILCLIMGGLSGFKNVMQSSMVLIGPDVLGNAIDMQKGMGMSEAQLQPARMMVKVLREPAYRVVEGIESALTMLMAVVLFVAGVGLLRGQLWGLRLTRWWAYYALASAVASVVLEMRYVQPHTGNVPPGLGLVSAVFMLLMLWSFPVLLLTVLRRPVVIDYLRWRATQGAGQPSMPGRPVAQTTASYASDAPERPTPTPLTPTPPESTPPPKAPPPAPPRSPVPDTWRDDPWNDPNSQ